MNQPISIYELGGVVLVAISAFRLIERLFDKALAVRRNNRQESTQETSITQTCNISEKVSKEVCEERHKSVDEKLDVLFNKQNQTIGLVTEVKEDVGKIKPQPLNLEDTRTLAEEIGKYIKE